MGLSVVSVLMVVGAFLCFAAQLISVSTVGWRKRLIDYVVFSGLNQYSTWYKQTVWVGLWRRCWSPVDGSETVCDYVRWDFMVDSDVGENVNKQFPYGPRQVTWWWVINLVRGTELLSGFLYLICLIFAILYVCADDEDRPHRRRTARAVAITVILSMLSAMVGLVVYVKRFFDTAELYKDTLHYSCYMAVAALFPALFVAILALREACFRKFRIPDDPTDEAISMSTMRSSAGGGVPRKERGLPPPPAAQQSEFSTLASEHSPRLRSHEKFFGAPLAKKGSEELEPVMVHHGGGSGWIEDEESESQYPTTSRSGRHPMTMTPSSTLQSHVSHDYPSSSAADTPPVRVVYKPPAQPERPVLQPSRPPKPPGSTMQPGSSQGGTFGARLGSASEGYEGPYRAEMVSPSVSSEDSGSTPQHRGHPQISHDPQPLPDVRRPHQPYPPQQPSRPAPYRVPQYPGAARDVADHGSRREPAQVPGAGYPHSLPVRPTRSYDELREVQAPRPPPEPQAIGAYRMEPELPPRPPRSTLPAGMQASRSFEGGLDYSQRPTRPYRPPPSVTSEPYGGDREYHETFM